MCALFRVLDYQAFVGDVVYGPTVTAISNIFRFSHWPMEGSSAKAPGLKSPSKPRATCPCWDQQTWHLGHISCPSLSSATSSGYHKLLSFSRTSSLPTAGIGSTMSTSHITANFKYIKAAIFQHLFLLYKAHWILVYAEVQKNIFTCFSSQISNIFNDLMYFIFNQNSNWFQQIVNRTECMNTYLGGGSKVS